MDDHGTVRYAIVGFGLAGSTFHAPLIANCRGAELAAVVARRPETAEQVRAQYPGTTTVAAVDELAALDIDAAVVATPTATHAEIAIGLMAAGIGAVVDKPLAITVADGEAMIAASEATGTLLTCYQNRRWDSDYLTVQRLMREDALGVVHRFESRIERWRPSVKPGWKEIPGPGAGVLYDLGPHTVDQALQLLGPASEVYSELRIVRPTAQVPDDSFLALQHESGAISQLWVSLTAAAPGPRFRVLGERAAFVIDGTDPQEAALRAGRVPTDEWWGSVPEADWGWLADGDSRRQVPTANGNYLQFYNELTAHIAGKGSLPVDPRDSLAALRIIEEATRAAQE